MPSRDEIKAFYRAEHDRISKAYYRDKTLDALSFRAQHEQNWRDMMQALLSSGYARQVWHYVLSATISTPKGPVTVKVAIESPVQLTVTDKSQYLQAINGANWALESEIAEVVET